MQPIKACMTENKWKTSGVDPDVALHYVGQIVSLPVPKLDIF